VPFQARTNSSRRSKIVKVGLMSGSVLTEIVLRVFSKFYLGDIKRRKALGAASVE